MQRHDHHPTITRIALSLILAFSCACIARPACADQLDDQSIRALYKEANAIVGDQLQTRRFLEARLNDDYKLQDNVAQLIGDDPEHDVALTLVKIDVIEDAVRGDGVMRAETFTNHISRIRYTADDRSAYVTDETTSAGTISTMAQDGHYVASKYSEAESCVKQVGLVNGTLKFLKGVCNEKFAVR